MNNRDFPEASLEQVLAEPIIVALMRRDGWSVEGVRATFMRSVGHRRPTGFGGADEDIRPESDHPLCRLSPLCNGILPLLGCTAAIGILLWTLHLAA